MWRLSYFAPVLPLVRLLLVPRVRRAGVCACSQSTATRRYVRQGLLDRQGGGRGTQKAIELYELEQLSKREGMVMQLS